MIVDLQCRAHGIRCRPGRGAFAVNVEHETSDRHRRIRTIVDQVVPILVAKFCHVHPERRQQVARMTGRQAALGERVAQDDRLALASALPKQIGLKLVEQFELRLRIERGMIGDIVRGPNEIIKREDQRPVTRMDDPRRHRKILVAMGFAGSQFAQQWSSELAALVEHGGSARPGWSAGVQDRSRTPYMGNSRAKPMLSRDFAKRRPRPERTRSGQASAFNSLRENYCPWLVSTWLQALVSFGRFC